jgi:hypothetical protein
MATRAGERGLGDVRARSEGERTSGDRYLRARESVRSGGPASVDPARPLEFDESGFPIAQRPSTFVQRVARLLAR